MVECPVCRTSNVPGSLYCVKCNAAFQLEADTLVDPLANPPEKPTIDSDSPSEQETIAGATGWSDPTQQATGSAASGPLSAGRVLGERYEILKALGEGGMGAVYKARDRELDRLLALKVIRPELANRPDILRRFKQELILSRQVTHKNVVRIFDLGMADGYKFITMDYIEGRDLKSVLEDRTKLPPAEAVPIFQQICRGLEAAHTEGVIHRDLKPQNIMVDEQGRVSVMDFGLARSLELSGLTRTGALLGTPDYMSPEQARGNKVDARSDLFSLGVIFYETLTGRLPFAADTVMAAMLKRCQEPPLPPVQVDPGIPQQLNDIVMKCLAMNPAERYQTVGEVLADLSGKPAAVPEGSVMRTGVTFGPAAVESAMALTEIAPGAQFGPRYLIESVIGEGGMGKVYKAQDRDLERTVALKLVRPELASNPAAMQRFKQELLLASRISHKNILRIHDLGDVGGVKFISMAYVEGKDLHDLIQQDHPLPLERAIDIARQLAAALEAAHAEGVVHRDLKPRNVLVDQSEHVYVSDFGLAKSIEAESKTGMTRTGEVLGTPRYMSPEQAESKPADHRSDLYSLGVIFYEMVTGDTPFGGDSALQVMFQHVKQTPKNPKLLNPALPDYVAAIILKCLEKDPAKRYQSAREFLEDLDSGRVPQRTTQRTLEIKIGRPAWVAAWLTVSAVVVLGLLLAVPPVRHAIFPRLWPASSATTGATAPQTYLAVLPFRVIGDQPDLKLLADGVVDALSAKLFNLKNVYVASASAAEAAIKTNAPPEKIAKDLGVKLLVQGMVQGAGDKVSVVVSLDDVAGHRRLWHQEFPLVRQDLLTIEDQIYSRLVSALEVRPSTEEMARSATRPTDSIAAYQLYLRARNILHGGQDEKNVKAALDLYNEAINNDRHFALAFAGVADASRRMYELSKDSTWSEKASGAAQQAEALNDSLPEVHFALGGIYSTTGKSSAAIAELKRALELAPNSDEGYRRLGFAYLKAGQKEEALKAYQRAVEINQYYWLNYSHLGGAYLGAGKYDEALSAFQWVTKLASDSPTGYSNVGLVYLRQAKWNEAIPALQKALGIRPSITIYSNLGFAYFYLGNYAEAAKMFEQAVAITPDAQLVGNLADAYRWLGQREKANANYDKAIALALRDLQVNPNDIRTLEYLGLYYAKKGDTKQALRFIQRARTNDPSDNELMYNEGLIYALAGRKPEALRGLREAFQKGYSPKEAQNDPELRSLQKDPDFERLVKEFSRPTA